MIGYKKFKAWGLIDIYIKYRDNPFSSNREMFYYFPFCLAQLSTVSTVVLGNIREEIKLV